MGKLNIAHHKSYHPYRRDNIEKVRRDEEEAKLKKAQEEGRVLLADAEARIDLLRSRASASTKPNKRQIEKAEEKLISQRTSEAVLNAGHINLFEDLEYQSLAATSSKGRKKPVDETERGIPLAPSDKDLKPWYSTEGKERMTDSGDDRKRARDMNRKSTADPLTSIKSQLATAHPTSRPSVTRRKPPAAIEHPPSEREARLNRESSERQRAMELIQRKKREMMGSETPSTVRNGGYEDMYNKADVEEAHRFKDRRSGNIGRGRRW